MQKWKMTLFGVTNLFVVTKEELHCDEKQTVALKKVVFSSNSIFLLCRKQYRGSEGGRLPVQCSC
jgi:hypothetical protein